MLHVEDSPYERNAVTCKPSASAYDRPRTTLLSRSATHILSETIVGAPTMCGRRKSPSAIELVIVCILQVASSLQSGSEFELRHIPDDTVAEPTKLQGQTVQERALPDIGPEDAYISSDDVDGFGFDRTALHRSARRSRLDASLDVLGAHESTFRLRAYSMDGVDVTAQPFYYAGGLGSSVGLELSTLGRFERAHATMHAVACNHTNTMWRRR